MYSQTQLANIAIIGGILAIVLAKMGLNVTQEQVTFIIASLWSIGWSIFSFVQRYKKGDLTLGGFRK